MTPPVLSTGLPSLYHHDFDSLLQARGRLGVSRSEEAAGILLGLDLSLKCWRLCDERARA